MMIFQESFGLCPYLAEMQRESKRNARIRAGFDMEEDIPSGVMAHIRRRKERISRNRWVSLANDFRKRMELTEPVDLDCAKRYLQMARNEVDRIGRREKQKKWKRDGARTRNTLL